MRETEELMRRFKAAKKAPRVSPKRSSEDVHLTNLAEDLSRQLGTKVLIRTSGRQGRIEIEFYSNDDLDRLITRLRQITPRAFGELRRFNDIAHSPANLPTSAGSAPIPSPTGLPARKAR